MTGQSPKILIVENETIELMFFAQDLERAQIPYVIAKSASEAIHCLKTDPSIVLVSLDGDLDGPSGGEKASSRGEEVARYITSQMWNPKAGQTFPRFVTASSDPYPAPGAMASFLKKDFAKILASDAGIRKIKHLFGVWQRAQTGSKASLSSLSAQRPPRWRALPALVRRELSA